MNFKSFPLFNELYSNAVVAVYVYQTVIANHLAELFLNMTLQALGQIPSLLEDIHKKGGREHKRLKFVNKSLLEDEVVEGKLQSYAVAHMSPAQLEHLRDRLTNCEGEARVVECLLELIHQAEERIEGHKALFKTVIRLLEETRAKCDDEEIALMTVEKCSLMIFDSFHFLAIVKHALGEVTHVYHVPYYYHSDGVTFRIRSSLLTTFKNLNMIIDDLQALSDALFYVRHFDVLA